MGKKKKFIDKKSAVSFHLVHRSQRDPLQAADEAPEHVLVPVPESHSQTQDPEKAAETRQDEQRKFGVFFDDDYDYMQHLRDVSELSNVEPLQVVRFKDVDNHSDSVTDGLSSNFDDDSQADDRPEPSLQLPSTVFGSNVETDVGLLNKAVPVTGPQVDWDPDIVAALDDDFDYDDPDNCLDNDFMALANAEEMDGPAGVPDASDSQFKSDRMNEYFRSQARAENFRSDSSGDGVIGSDDDDDEDDDLSDVDSLGEMTSFSAEETKSHFTNYSMTSSVIKRNEGLTLLDDRFGKLYEEYGDDQIGALDHEDIEGRLQQGSVLLDAALEQFTEAQNEKKLKDVVLKAEDMAVASDSDSSEAEDMVRVAVEEPREKWDCESILSTYSTLYNHPQTISEPKKAKPIKLSQRGLVVEDGVKDRGLTHKELQQENKHDRASTFRPQDESVEERRERKKAIKEERRVSFVQVQSD